MHPTCPDDRGGGETLALSTSETGALGSFGRGDDLDVSACLQSWRGRDEMLMLMLDKKRERDCQNPKENVSMRHGGI